MTSLKNSVLISRLTFLITGCILLVGCACMPYVKPKFTTDPTQAMIFDKNKEIGISEVNAGITCRY